MRSCLLAVSLFVLAQPSVAQAQSDPGPLTRLKAVRVHVAEYSDATIVGLSSESLSTAVELRLRQSGITVDEEGAALFVFVSVLDRQVAGAYAYEAEIRLLEGVYALRNMRADLDPYPASRREFVERVEENIHTGATWRSSVLGLAVSNTARTRIRDSVLELVDRFANDYLAANPR